jgi:hypothetical protein
MRRHEAETLSVSAERERDWRAFVCPVSMQIKAERVAKVETRGRGCFELGRARKAWQYSFEFNSFSDNQTKQQTQQQRWDALIFVLLAWRFLLFH